MIYIIRHGQTAGNKANVLQGRGSNHPLIEQGILQVHLAGRWFREQDIRIDQVYSSPLTRAVQTAKLITDRPVITDARLTEMDYGPYEGTDLKNLPRELKIFFSDFSRNPAPRGMEPLSEVVARMGRFLEEIREEVQHKTILISTHAIAMKGALEYLTPASGGRWWSQYIGNCAVFAVDINPDGTYAVPVEIKTV